MQASEQKIRVDIVTLEIGGAIEDWRCGDDGTVAILLKLDVRCPCCCEMHVHFVNRDGRTLCVDCDAERTAGRKFA